MEIHEEISLIVTKRRKLLELTQKDLAELSDVSERTIRDIEQGKGNPGLVQLQKIFNILGLSISMGTIRND